MNIWMVILFLIFYLIYVLLVGWMARFLNDEVNECTNMSVFFPALGSLSSQCAYFRHSSPSHLMFRPFICEGQPIRTFVYRDGKGS